MIITETKLNASIKIKIRNYFIYRNDRLGRGGGVAILVYKKIPHHPLPSLNISIENIAIDLQDGTTIRAAYNQPRNAMTGADLTSLTSGNKVLVLGDLNAKHTTWNNRRNNRNGVAVYEFANDNDLVVLAPDTPTHFPTNGTSPTFIDIVILKNYTEPISPNAMSDLNSDHNPVVININSTDISNTNKYIYNYKTCNWKKFRERINNNITINNTINSKGEIDREITKITNAIITARNSTTRLIKRQPKENIIPSEVKHLIQFKNRLKKRWQRTRSNADRLRLNAIQETITEKLMDFRDKVWRDRISNLTHKDSSIWTMTKLLTRPYDPIPSIKTPTNVIYTDAAKAAAFTEHLANICTSPPNLTERQQRITDDVNAMPSTNRIPNRAYGKLFTDFEELRKIIKQLPNNKAPGLDEIANITLKNLPKKAVVQIMYIINAVLKIQYFPDSWKQAVIIPIRKAGKEPTKLDSYRPISLLPSISKIAEKIIHARLNAWVNRHSIVPNTQMGFRAGHSTTHAAAKFSQDAIIAANRKLTTVALSLDLKRAFDTIWHEGLIYKLTRLNLPKHYVTLIKNYLSNRTIRTRVNCAVSHPRHISAGVPQGTVLSPLLYNLYVCDLPKIPTCTVIQYADDTLVYTASFAAQAANNRLKYYATKLKKYYDEWKLIINPEKSETITLTKKFVNIDIQTPIIIDNIPIQNKKTVKYLGVTFDKRISFIQHLTTAINKVYMARNKLYPLLNRNSTIKTETKIILYKTIIRPILSYAAPAWNNVTNAQYARLQITQNRLLRLITNSDIYTNMNRLHLTYNVPKIREYLKEMAKNFFHYRKNNTELTTDICNIPPQLRRVHKYLHAELE